MKPMQLPSWKPRSFQRDGIKLMISQACAGLLFPPGGGKTSTVYMAFRILQDKKYVEKMLVICPVRPMYRVWPHQKDKFAEFQHLRVAVLHGPDKEALLHSDDYDIYVVNPEGLPWLFEIDPAGLPNKRRLAMLKAKFPMLVVDESTKFKNSQTKRFKILKHLVPHFKRRYILTGSFTSKGLLDLFGQVYILDEGQSLGRYITHFRNKFFYPSGYGGYEWTPQPDARERIAERISPLVIRVDLDDMGIDLPELVFDDIWVDLPKAARQQYDLMEDALVARLEGGSVVAANAAVASSKCRQIANGILFDSEDQGKWHAIHDEKLDALEDLMEQLQGHPLLITYEFKPDAERITKRLKVVSISTGNAKKDDQNIELFSKGLLTAVQGHPDSIALGIDGLQDSCSHIAMVGVTWNLINYQQVIDRVRRQGSKSKRVIVHRILARNTLDERTIQVLDAREKDQGAFLTMLKELRNGS
jgi:hypothetical protein